MKYVGLFLAAFTLLILTEGCGLVKILNDPVKAIEGLISGKPKPPPILDTLGDPKNMSEEDAKRVRAWCAKYSKPTVIEKVRSLLILGATVGLVLTIVCALILIFVKGAPKKPCGIGIVVGLVLVVVSILLDKYLQAILLVGVVLLGIAAVVLVRKHWQKIKKMVAFTDEVKKKGQVTEEQVHAAARKTIGETGSKDRESIKALVESTRTVKEA